MITDKKSLIDFALRKLVSITKDMEDIENATADCEINDNLKEFPYYYLICAKDSLRHSKERLWSALGDACDYDLKNIVDVMEQIAREGKYGED